MNFTQRVEICAHLLDDVRIGRPSKNFCVPIQVVTVSGVWIDGGTLAESGASGCFMIPLRLLSVLALVYLTLNSTETACHVSVLDRGIHITSLWSPIPFCEGETISFLP